VKLAVLGATGRTGRLVIAEATTRGHAVAAVTRRTVPLDPDALAQVLVGQDVVISCLGHRGDDSPTLLRDAAASALDAMARAGVRRYLVVSQGLLFPERHIMFRLVRLFLRRQLADSDAMERVVRASLIDWTIVRPPRLTDGSTPRGYRAEVAGWPRGGWSMQRIDLATCLVDVAERGTYARVIVGVAAPLRYPGRPPTARGDQLPATGPRGRSM